MSDQPTVFENKRERQDFWIAILVILLFVLFLLKYLGFMPGWLSSDKLLPSVEPEIAIAAEMPDRDGDGIVDSEDNCPDLVGIIGNNGCPADPDGDGIYGNSDKCPNYAGTKDNFGCPADADGDGVHDGIDKCPNKIGPISSNGCPVLADSDKDGVPDDADKCPNLAGKKENNGCPDVKIEAKDLEAINVAAKDVQFETASANLKQNSLSKLDRIVSIMEKYPKYKLRIEGHTDNQGEAVKNQKLSEARAQSCFEYIRSKGVSKRRLIYKGYGEKRPIDSNETPAGKANNRRVEFHFQY